MVEDQNRSYPSVEVILMLLEVAWAVDKILLQLTFHVNFMPTINLDHALKKTIATPVSATACPAILVNVKTYSEAS